MTNSNLEITENQYCIKLSKDMFDLSLIRQLIKRIELESSFTNQKNELYEDDLISRSLRNYNENFDRLDDK